MTRTCQFVIAIETKKLNMCALDQKNNAKSLNHNNFTAGNVTKKITSMIILLKKSLMWLNSYKNIGKSLEQTI